MKSDKLSMLSNSSKYAIKGVLHLANHSNEDHKIMVRDIYDTINVPEAYLAKLFQQLSKHQIISSMKGPKGGYYITDVNREQPVYRVIEIIDGNHRLEDCVLGIEECNTEHPCPLHEYVNPTRAVLLNTLKKMTIGELANKLDKGYSFLS